MNQRRGRAAEAQFELLCATAGITCNPSEQDDYGWDFLVEIPMLAPRGSPADKWPAPRPAFVQVKSTERARSRAKMKVSNAVALAKNPAPCFIVLFHQLKAGQRIYAKLFGEKDMRRALKRARQLSVERKQVNRTEITFPFSDEDDHTMDLLDWMLDSVQGLAPDHGKAKSRLAERIGYGKGGYRAKVTLAGSRGLDDLVDLQLGLKDELEVSGFAVFVRRFEIEAPAPILEDHDGGIFRVQPENEIECQVTLESDNDVMSLRSTARFSALKGASSMDVRFSFLNELFVLLVSSEEISLTLRDVTSTKLPLRQLEQLATILAWRDQDVRIRITGDVPDITLKMHVPEDVETHLDSGVATAIATLRDLASRSPHPYLTLSLNDVLAKYRELRFYLDVLSNAEMSMQSRPHSQAFDPAELKNFLGFVDVEVGEYTFLTLFDADIEACLDASGELKVQLGARNERESIVGVGRQTVRSLGQETYERQTAGYGDHWFAVGSLNELIESPDDGQTNHRTIAYRD